MKQMMTRRNFLQTAGTAAVVGAGRGLAAPGLAPDVGADPNGAKIPRLFSGCCAYSYGKYLNHGQMTMEDFIRTAVDMRLDGVDMTGYYFKSTDPKYFASLRHLAYKSGVAFSGAACGVTMVQADPAKRADALNEIKKWVDVTDQLGAPHLRVFAGKLPPGTAVTEALGWVVETMKAASDYSGKKGIMVGVEDHQGVSQSADVCLEIMQRVNSPYAGINLDITHFIPTPTADAYAQIASCIRYATNTHIRDRFDDGTPIDLDRVWRMFATAGFKGFMSAEYERKYEGHEDARTGVPKLVAKITALCKKYSSL